MKKKENYILLFCKENTTAAILAVVAVLYTSLYVLVNSATTSFESWHLYPLYNVLLQLSCSYIAGVIIYILTTLIAEVAREKEIQGKIDSYVRILRAHMKECLDGYAMTNFGQTKEEYSAEELMHIAESFNPFGEIKRIKHVHENQTYTYFTCFEWTINYSRIIDKEIIELQKIYGTHISVDLFKILGKISNAMLQKHIPYLLHMSEGHLSIDKKSEVFEEYYKLIKELDAYLKMHESLQYE